MTTLEQLDAIRYDMDGDGTPTDAGADEYIDAFGGLVVCGTNCSGYELESDLDFEDVGSYGSGSLNADWIDPDGGTSVEGWLPIGVQYSSPFTTVFKGNGHTISNLYINRPSTSGVGLFGALNSSATLHGVGIEGGSVIARANVGGLVGASSGKILACYNTGDVEVLGSYANAGGLVGTNASQGTIRACYSTGSVEASGGNANVGGLVGYSAYQGTIRACYSTGSVEASGTGNNVGGLLGFSYTSTVEACYTRGIAAAPGVNDLGGLIGEIDNGTTVTASYFNRDAYTTAVPPIAVPQDIGEVPLNFTVPDIGQITADLASPMGYTDLYSAWNLDLDDGLAIGIDDATTAGDGSSVDDPWDFGTDEEYPILKVDFNANGTAVETEFGEQERTATIPPPPLGITGISPGTGPVDATVTISGTGFDTGGNVVTFLGTNDDGSDDKEAVITSEDAAEIVVEVPSSAKTGPIRVVVSGGASVDSDDDFTVVEITDISPDNGPVEATVTISGSGFSTVSGENVVTFLGAGGGDEQGATITSEDDMEIVVQVPTGAKTGPIRVVVNGGAPVESDDDFAIVEVTGISLTDGTVGEEVTISGSGFSTVSGENVVTFLGTSGGDEQEAMIVSETDVEIVAKVPSGAQIGPIQVVVNEGAPWESTDPFIVNPNINYVSPKSGAVDETVIITGTGFSNILGDNTVTFETGVDATITDGSATQLVVSVPSGAETGPIKVSVDGSSVTTESDDFGVFPSAVSANLIGITTLGQLDAIRYDLDGDGLPTSSNLADYNTAFGTSATADDNDDVHSGSTIRGYELETNLNFEDANTDGSADDKSIWAEGATTASPAIAGALTGGWEPIGTESSPFNAVFEGKGFKIFNIYIDRSAASDENIGLFGYLGAFARVLHVGIDKGSVTGYSNVGGLVGYSKGSVTGSYTTCSVSGQFDVGGLVGENDDGTIANCYATGSVGAEGTAGDAGGLVGRNSSGTILACYAEGNATAVDGAGGLVGENNLGTISACYAIGDALTTGDNGDAGGLAGLNIGDIIACYATGNASATGNNGNVGGIVGTNEDLILACYATGRASSSGTNNSVGGVAGSNLLVSKITVTYFDTDTYSSATPSITVPQGVGDNASIMDLGKTTSDLKDPLTYTDIYEDWNLDLDNGLSIGVDDDNTGDAALDNPWHFGATTEYPVLQVDFDEDNDATAYEFGGQGRGATSTVIITGISPDTGPVGETVIISGSGFSTTLGDNMVSFVGSGVSPKAAVITSVDDISGTTLEVVVPSDASTGPISVLVAGSAAVESRDNFTILEITGIAPDTGSAGETVTISGSGFSTTLEDNMVVFVGNGVLPRTEEVFYVNSNGTELKVKVPLGAQTGPISVSVGGMPTQSGSFTVVPSSGDDLVLINIYNLEQLDAIRFDLNGDGRVDGSATTADSIVYETAFGIMRGEDVDCTGGCEGYELMTDLDFTNTSSYAAGSLNNDWIDPSSGGTAATEGWPPIGTSTLDTSNPFNAVFEGDDNIISNLYINLTSSSYAGLFGYVSGRARIRNLGLDGGSVAGSSAGSLVGTIFGSAQVRACYSTSVSVTGGGLSFTTAGGLIGNSASGVKVIACYATGDVTSIGDDANAGGLVGRNGAKIIASYATGDVMSDGNAVGLNITAGGLVGYNSGDISASYAEGNVRAEGAPSLDFFLRANGGGLVGYVGSGTISASYATGDVTSMSDDVVIGGLVGSSWSDIKACYATGNVTSSGADTFVGSLVGRNRYEVNFGGYGGMIEGCYSIGRVIATNASSSVGGLMGDNEGPDTQVVNSYFDEGSSGITGGLGAQSSSALQTPVDYTDIYAAWNIDVDDGLSRGTDDGMTGGDDTEDSPWDFGTNAEYPVLKVDFGTAPDGTATAAEFGSQTRGAILSIRDLIPGYGQINDPIKIAGTAFSSTAAENEVSFGGSAYVAASSFLPGAAGPDTIVVNVPSDAVTGKVSVKVLGGTPVESVNEFTVLAVDELAITSISPTRGAVGEEVTITGQNFGATQSENMVTFVGVASDTNDDVPVPVSDITVTNTMKLIVRVPAGAVSGPIEVEVGGETATSSDVFTVVSSLAISKIDPELGAVGDPIKIAGIGFSSTAAENEVSFDGGTAYVVANDFIADTRTGVDPTIDTVVVNVPSGAQTGTIMVKVNDGTPVESANDFTVLSSTELAITSISPTEGPVGEEVTIEGQNFGATPADNTVTFRGNAADLADDVPVPVWVSNSNVRYRYFPVISSTSSSHEGDHVLCSRSSKILTP